MKYCEGNLHSLCYTGNMNTAPAHTITTGTLVRVDGLAFIVRRITTTTNHVILTSRSGTSVTVGKLEEVEVPA